MSSTYEEVYQLISNHGYKKAEHRLTRHPVKSHLEKAIALNPTNVVYQKHLAKLMARPGHYSDDYYRGCRYRRRSGCCCYTFCPNTYYTLLYLTFLLVYIVSSLLCLLLMPPNISTLYILFFGIYGLLKYFIEKLNHLFLPLPLL